MMQKLLTIKNLFKIWIPTWTVLEIKSIYYLLFAMSKYLTQIKIVMQTRIFHHTCIN